MRMMVVLVGSNRATTKPNQARISQANEEENTIMHLITPAPFLPGEVHIKLKALMGHTGRTQDTAPDTARGMALATTHQDEYNEVLGSLRPS